MGVKATRVFNFHQETVESVKALAQAMRITKLEEIYRWHILKKVGISKVLNFAELYPYVEKGAFLKEKTPEGYERVLKTCNVESFSHV